MAFNPNFNFDDENESEELPKIDTGLVQEIEELQTVVDPSKKKQSLHKFNLGPLLEDESDFVYNFSRKTQPNLMTGIYGMSGSGKTGVTKILVEEAVLNEIPSFIISPASDFYTLMKVQGETEEARELEERIQVVPLSFSDENQIPIHFPLFDLPSKADVKKQGLSSADLDLRFEKIATSYVNIAHGTESKNRVQQFTIYFTQLIREAYNRDVLISSINQLQELVQSDLSIGILRRLGLDRLKSNITLGIETIKTGQTKYLFDMGWSLDFDLFLNPINNNTPVNIIDIAEFNVDDQNKIVGTFCSLLLNWGISGGLTKDIRAIVIIDEAHNYCPKGNRVTAGKRPIERLVREGRKYGLVCILATQLPRDLDAGVRANLGIVSLGKSIRDEVKEVHKDVLAQSEMDIDIEQLYSLESREFAWIDSSNVSFFKSRNLYSVFDKIDPDLINVIATELKPHLPEIKKKKEFEIDFGLLESDDNELVEDVEETLRENKIEAVYLNMKSFGDIQEEIIRSVGDSDAEFTIDNRYTVYLPFLLGSNNVKINSQPSFDKDGETVTALPTSIFEVYVIPSLLDILNFNQLKIDDEKLPQELWIMNTELSELSHYTQEVLPNLLANLDRKVPRSYEFDATGINEILASETLQKSFVINALQQMIREYVIQNFSGSGSKKTKPIKTDGSKQLKLELATKLKEYKGITGGVNKGLLQAQYQATLKKTVEWKRKVEKLKEAGKYDNYYKDVTAQRLDEFDRIKNKIDRIKTLESEIAELRAQLKQPTSKSKGNTSSNSKLVTFLKELKTWSPGKADSIDSLDFTLVYVPYNLTTGMYGDHSFITMKEAHQGSDLYLSCVYCLEKRGISDSQLHILVWECGAKLCNRLICDFHSQVSQYSQKHLCDEHQGECGICGIVEPLVLQLCENCGQPFCPNHITLKSKRFKKDQYLCDNCTE